MDPLASLDRSTLRERALEALRAAITSGQYRPGDHLGEVELAKNLGVSRGTVREALRHLQQEGLVTAGNRGMLRVNSLSPEEVRELFQVRAALEGLAVATIIASPDRQSAVKSLRDALTDLADAADGRAAGAVRAGARVPPRSGPLPDRSAGGARSSVGREEQGDAEAFAGRRTREHR